MITITYTKGEIVIIWSDPINEKGKARKAQLVDYINTVEPLEEWTAKVKTQKDYIFSHVYLLSKQNTGQQLLLLGGTQYANKF